MSGGSPVIARAMQPYAESSEPPRIHASSVIVMILGIALATMLLPARTASAVEPLPAGAYEVQLGSRLVTIEAAADGGAEITAPDDVVVQLSFDEHGNVLSRAVVATPTETYQVAFILGETGAYRVRIDEHQNLRIDLTDSSVVGIVAACTPSGLVAASVGLPNHGTTVSMAASGMRDVFVVDNPVDGTSTPVIADFSSRSGALAYCDDVQLAVPTVEELRALVAEQRAANLGPEADG